MPFAPGRKKTGGRKRKPTGPRIEIVYRVALELKPYERNPRKNDKAVDRMVASIREYGFTVPVLIRSNGDVIDGHLRLKGAIKLAMLEVPCIVCDSWTPAQVKAFRLMANRSVTWADWDVDALAAEFADLKALDFDLSLTGFDSREIDGFTLQANPAEDEVPPVPEIPRTKLGDLWLMGEHRLLCGDCRDVATVARLLDGARVNVVITSPPYAEQREYDKSSGFRPVPPDEYVEWFQPVADNIRSVMASDGSYFLNIKPSCDGINTELYVLDLVLAHARRWGWHFATEFCWERNGVPKSVTQRFKNQFEPVYQFALNRWKMRPDAVRHYSHNVPTAGGVGSGDTNWANKQGGRGATSVSGSFGSAKKRRNGRNGGSLSDESEQGVGKYQMAPGEYIGPGLAYPGNRLPTFASSHEATGHVAAFPLGLPRFFIEAYADPGDVTFDPFAGSGSTMIASENTGRRGYGMELSPAYCDVIVTRWEKLTGKKSTLESTGECFSNA